jgi:CRISPR-associated protein Csd2
MYQSKDYVVSSSIAATMSASQLANVIVVEDLSAVVNLFISGLILISGERTNPQGDIDTGGAPRQNPCNQKGLMTCVGWKRKQRDASQFMYDLPLHVARRGVLLQGTLDAALAKCPDKAAVEELTALVDNQRAAIAKAAASKNGGKKGKKAPEVSEVDLDDPLVAVGEGDTDSEESKSRRDWTSVRKANHEYFVDDRTYGRLFTDPMNEGDTGPVQISHLQTLHPIEIIEMAIGCTAVANYKEKATKDNTIGRMSIINFGLYSGTITINPRHAQTTGFTWNDLNMFLNTVPMLWDLSQSTSRTGVSHERLYLFIHESAYGSAPLNKLVKLVKPMDLKPETGPDIPRQSMDDYQLIEPEDLDGKLPAGVKLVVI